MKKSKRIVVVLVVATGLLMPVIGLLFADKLVPVLGPVLPRPDGVPREASAAFDFKEGIFWRWRRTAPHGCAAWMAMDRWATVTLARGQEGCADKSISLHYASFDDHVVFDWGRGTWSGGKPCPFTVPPGELAAYLKLTREARNAANTDKERAMLSHVEQRLTAANGSKLTTDHTGGCNDFQQADYAAPPKRHRDVWSPD